MAAVPLYAGPVPEELGALAELTVLRLDFNKLTGKGDPMKISISIF